MVERRGDERVTAVAKVTVDVVFTSPPRNLQQLYAALLDEVRVIRKELGLLEKEFYDEASPHEFLSRWIPVAKEAMRCHSLAELNSLRQIQSVIFLARDPDVKEMYPSLTPIGPDTCAQLCQLQNKILAFLPGRFTLVMDKIGRVRGLCDKYLLSFYSADSPHPIDTASKYTTNRRAWSVQAAERAKSVLYNSHLFLRESLTAARLAKGAVEQLRRAEAASAPFLGLFADACENLRSCLDILVEWISFDRNYPMYLKADLAVLEKRRAELEKQVKAQRHQLHMAQYRSKSLHSEKAKLHLELQALADREAELLVEEEQLHQDLKNARLDLEIKEFRREELKREGSKETAVDAEITGLVDQLRMLRLDIPQMERRLLSLRSKLTVIEEKQKRSGDVATALRDTDGLMEKLRTEVTEASGQLLAGERTLDKCTEIYRLKTSSDTPERIFYGLQLDGAGGGGGSRGSEVAVKQPGLPQTASTKSLSAPGSGATVNNGGGGGVSQLSSRRGDFSSPLGTQVNVSSTASMAGEGKIRRSDTAELNGSAFDQVCLLVAHKIERDWKRLYRALPFVPQRGRETIDKDISELQSSFIGDSLFECAWRAIQRWRRYHRRAKLTELRSALERMRRADVVDDIDAFLRPPEALSEEAARLAAGHLDKQLVSFYRQLEPFDSQQFPSQQQPDVVK